MKLVISTWNVNGIRARIDNILLWLQKNDPHILCIQETKCQNEDFPEDLFHSLGYKTYINGQKSFNGVAILSKHDLFDLKYSLANNNDDQARFLEAKMEITKRDTFIINCIYLPNGNPLNTDKFSYKLEWMKNLLKVAENNIITGHPYIILGDFNIIPTADDVFDELRWTDDALYDIRARKIYRELINLGLYDSSLIDKKIKKNYTHWDYTGGAWQKNEGIRIDHILISSTCCKYYKSVETYIEERGLDKPSDHVPVSLTLDIGN